MKKKFQDYTKIVVFDTETTGLNPKNDNIIEFGALVLKKDDQGKYTRRGINQLVQNDEPLSDVIIKLTNITDDMLASDGISREALCDIMADLFTEEALVIAYNLQFDMGFVLETMRRYNPNFTFKADVLDAMAVFKDRFPVKSKYTKSTKEDLIIGYPSSHKLEAAIVFCNDIAPGTITAENTHRAYDDAYATYELIGYLNKQEDISPYINWIGYNDYYKRYYVKLPLDYINDAPHNQFERHSLLKQIKKDLH